MGVVRRIAAVGLVARAAAAQPIPGTADDPIRELAIEPGVADTPSGLAIRGGAPVDTVVLVDGFAVPWFDHIAGVRSIFTPSTVGPLGYHPAGFDVAYGGGTSLIDVTTRAARSGFRYDIVESGYGFERAVAFDAREILVAARGSWSMLALPTVGDPPASTSSTPGDAELRVDHRFDNHWSAAASVIASHDDDKQFVRSTVAVGYHSPAWQARFAASVMPVSIDDDEGEQHLHVREVALDARGEGVRTYSTLVGLTDVTVRFGAQVDSTYYKLDLAWPFLPREGLAQAATADPSDRSLSVMRTIWRHDLATWTALAGNLSPAIRAELGLRLDSFAGDVATQPRGTLTWQLARTTSMRLAIGSYRRPPEQLDEIVDASLHPERTTQIDVSVAHAWLTGSLYYIDRTRLVIRDGNGVLHNSGFGTSAGAELSAIVARGRWPARGAVSLAQSVRQDHLRAAERPAETDQPFRFDGSVAWRYGAWQLGARLRLASGLPYTPVVGAVYDSDRDRYQPLFGEVYSARLPFQHQLDLRVDRRFGRIAAFLDLHDAYGSRAALGYFYSFDYRERFARTLPVFPFIGIGGTL